MTNNTLERVKSTNTVSPERLVALSSVLLKRAGVEVQPTFGHIVTAAMRECELTVTADQVRNLFAQTDTMPAGAIFALQHANAVGLGMRGFVEDIGADPGILFEADRDQESVVKVDDFWDGRAGVLNMIHMYLQEGVK